MDETEWSIVSLTHVMVEVSLIPLDVVSLTPGSLLLAHASHTSEVIVGTT